jgi:hypothetical protein
MFHWTYIGPPVNDAKNILRLVREPEFQIDMSNMNQFIPNIALYLTDRINLQRAVAPFVFETK